VIPYDKAVRWSSTNSYTVSLNVLTFNSNSSADDDVFCSIRPLFYLRVNLSHFKNLIKLVNFLNGKSQTTAKKLNIKITVQRTCCDSNSVTQTM